MLFGQVAGGSHDARGDLHHIDLSKASLEGLFGIHQSRRGEAARPPSGREGGARLGVGQPAGHGAVGRIPQRAGVLRALLRNHQLHEGRGLEVDDHLRCSLTSSETGPLLFTRRCSRSVLLGCSARVTTPAEISRSSGSRDDTLVRRAIGLPRSVTTTPSPLCATSSQCRSSSRSLRTPTSIWYTSTVAGGTLYNTFASIGRNRLAIPYGAFHKGCLLYTSDAADDLLCVDLGGRRIIKKKKK